MNLPQLPTDNLYKFIALSGLLISGFVYFYKEYVLDEIKTDLFLIETQVGQLEIENSYLELELKDSKKSELLLKKIAIKKFRITQLLKEVEYKNNKASNNLWIWTILLGLGGLMTIIGFRLWYVRVQKPLDQKLQKELSNLSK